MAALAILRSRYPEAVTEVRGKLRSLLTLGGSPRGIAGGFALGFTLSLLPIPMVGMVAALALAPFLRLNLPATYVGTAVVNPFTGVFFYGSELWLGMSLMGADPPPWAELRALEPRGWWALVKTMTLPFALGATVLMLVSLPVVFALVYVAVRRWRIPILDRDATAPDSPAAHSSPRKKSAAPGDPEAADST